MKEINKLADIANELDKQGLTQYADIITDVMRRIAQFNQKEDTLPENLNEQYNENVLKQTFMEKYHLFFQIVNTAKDAHYQKNIDMNLLQGLYDEMVHISSNYLKNDPDVFNRMKFVVTTKQGLLK